MTQERKKRSTRKKTRKVSWGKVFLILLLTTIVIVGGLVFGIVANALKGMPSLDDQNFDDFAVTSYILDKDGNYVDKLHATENRIPVELSEMSPHMANALIAIEDQRFYKHHGVDPIRIAGALVANIKAGRTVQGGSTITQQLVGLTMLDRSEKSYTRKIQEAALALKMETEYTKDEILEHYLNRVYFGSGAYGVEAAANTFFGKSAIDLNIQESAMLAGMIQNPSKHSPISKPENALKRRSIVLSSMVDTKAITQEQYNELNATEIELATKSSSSDNKNNSQYQSFVDHVINEAIDVLELGDNTKQIYTGGYVIHTTLDPKVQSVMEKVYSNNSNFPKGSNGEIIQSAMVVTDPKNGAVRGIVGGRNQVGQRQFNRATQGVRQPGSAFKPISVYAPAFEKGYGLGSVEDDYPKSYNGKVFKNQNEKNLGLITYREAIKRSNNVVAVRVLEKIGASAGYKFANQFDFANLVESDKNLSLALGGLTHGVTPLELAGAYASFANGGVYIKPYVITKIEDTDGNIVWENKPEKEVVMSEQTAYLVNNALMSVVTESYGTGRKAAISGLQVAGKTGTTSDKKDIWFAGYTPTYVGTVWMGYDDPRRMNNVSGGGTEGAAVWKEVMAEIHKGLPKETFNKPSGIANVTIDTKSGLLPSKLTPQEFRKSELFPKNGAPKAVSTVWEQVEIDPESGQLYTPNCPNEPELRTFLVRPIPWQENQVNGAVPLDAHLEKPTKTCELHGEGFVPKPEEPGASEGVSLSGTANIDSSGKLTGATLSWNWSQQTDSTIYQIHRSTSPGFIPSSTNLIATTKNTSYKDVVPTTSNEYYYLIVPVDEATDLKSAASNQLKVSASKPTPEPEVKPDPEVENPKPGGEVVESSSISLSAQASSNGITLNWSAPSSAKKYNYYVFRSTSSSAAADPSTQIGSSQVITSTSFTDTTAESGVTYYYKVIAQNAAGEQVATSSVASTTAS